MYRLRDVGYGATVVNSENEFECEKDNCYGLVKELNRLQNELDSKESRLNEFKLYCNEKGTCAFHCNAGDQVEFMYHDKHRIGPIYHVANDYLTLEVNEDETHYKNFRWEDVEDFKFVIEEITNV